jgi:glycine cleavage system transcriptional repressor
VNLALTAVGRDRPGIVAGLTGVLVESGGNVDDSQMSILHGQFAVVLLVSVPPECDVEAMAASLEKKGEELGLDSVNVCPVSDLERGSDPSHLLTVYGADRPGIVHDAAVVLADHGVNITDLRTKRTGPSESAIYVLVMELAVPDSVEDLELELGRLGEGTGMEVSLSELETDVI